MVRKLKAAAWDMLAGAYYYSGLPTVRHRGRVAILTYHRVVSDEMVREEYIQAGMYVKAQSFASHVNYLRKRFVILPLEKVLELWQTGRLDARIAYCVITLDDGWRDNYDNAFPILKRHGVPATIFLATDYIGTTHWFWPDQAAFVLGQAGQRIGNAKMFTTISRLICEQAEIKESERENFRSMFQSGDDLDPDTFIEWCKGLEADAVLRVVERLGQELGVELPRKRVLLNWDEVREMSACGVTFGSHSCSHRIMTQLSPSEARKELTESWQAMLQQGIKPIPVFCYPNGNANETVKALTRDNGYQAALGCGVGLEGKRPDDLFDLKRLGLHEDLTSSTPLLALALSGLR
ncbi:MAG TPA: polysaccharide deacetylase family protein [Nitrospira sp.]|nr:polysaccharide deacetylase family protein [Nitrospira sp.]